MPEDEPLSIDIAVLIEQAVEWAGKLRTIRDRLNARSQNPEAARVLDKMAMALDQGVGQHHSGTLAEASEELLADFVERLNEATWNGKTSHTKNDVLRQANFGVFPQVAELLVRSMNEETRRADALHSRTFLHDSGEIDLSDADGPKR